MLLFDLLRADSRRAYGFFVATAIAAFGFAGAAQAQTNAGGEGMPFISTDPDVICTTLDLDGELALLEGDVAVGYCTQDAGGAWTFEPRGALGEAVMGVAPRGALYFASWDSAVIPYVIDTSLSQAAAPFTYEDIQRAIAHWRHTSGVRLVPRTGQSDYVEFVAGTGCSSFIGRIGGGQPITLVDNGACGFGATVHEIGHALGYYHEQSRQDRDTYVTINFGNIESGREFNFNKYTPAFGFDEGPYDYGSIMHYSALAFSDNGMPTIETNEPEFSNWQAIYGNEDIGNRRALSVLDEASATYYREFCYDTVGSGSAEWVTNTWSRCTTDCVSSGRSRAVHCVDAGGSCVDDSNCDAGSKPAETEDCTTSISTNFLADTGAWDYRDPDGDIEWLVGRGETPSSSTGPSVDHSTGTDSGAYYFLEVSGRTTGEIGYMTTVPITIPASTTLSFWYHTFGSSIEPISLEIVPCATGTPTTLWTSDNVSQDLWRQAVVAIPADPSARLRFRGTVGSSFQGDVAIDDILFAPGGTTTTTTTSTTTTTTLPIGTCGPVPESGCFASAKASFQIKDSSNNDKDQVKWKFIKGDAFDQADLGDPVGTNAYELCVYDSSSSTDALVASLRVEPGSDWLSKDPKGWLYKDKFGSSDGVTKVQLKTGAAGKTKAQLAAKGSSITLPGAFSGSAYFDSDPAVTVQLIQRDALDMVVECWTSQFSASGAKKNEPEQYKAKAP